MANIFEQDFIKEFSQRPIRYEKVSMWLFTRKMKTKTVMRYYHPLTR